MSGIPTYLFLLGMVIIVAVGLLPVTLPSTNDILVPDLGQRYTLPPLTRGVVVAQQFPAGNGAINSVALMFGTNHRMYPGAVSVELRVNRDGIWQTLATQTVAQSSLRHAAYTTFAFSPPLHVIEGEQVQIAVQSDSATPGVSVFAIQDWPHPDGYVLTISDVPQPGAGILRVSYNRESGHVFGMLGTIWRRSTVLLSVRWQIVLVAALGILLLGIVMLGRVVAPDRIPPDE